MREDQQLVRCCFLVFTQNNQFKDSLSIDKLDQRENEEIDELIEQLIFILLKEDLEKIVYIGS